MSNTPERIYGWLNTQLSIARHYGGIKYNGKDYKIAVDEEGQPLVRVDVLKREKRAKGVKQADEFRPPQDLFDDAMRVVLGQHPADTAEACQEPKP